MPLLTTGAGAYAGGGTVDPPAFTFQSVSTGSVAGSVLSTASSAGTPNSTRFVAILFSYVTNGTLSSAVFNAAGTPVPATVVVFGTDPGNSLYALAYAIVPADVSGGGITLDITVSGGGIFSGGDFSIYTADSSQFTSLTPSATGFNSVSSASSVTGQVNILSGGAVLAFGGRSGGTGTTFTTPNDPVVSTDGSLDSAVAGHKNNSSTFTPANIAIAFTAVDSGGIALAVWR